MGLMVNLGSELIRYNPSNGHIEYSTSQGRVWSARCTSRTFGTARALIVYGKELLLCSDKGVYYSTSKGAVWSLRCSSHKDFIDLTDGGRELLATTSDGKMYYSTSKGMVWSRR